jgi:hypothetical protein
MDLFIFMKSSRAQFPRAPGVKPDGETQLLDWLLLSAEAMKKPGAGDLKDLKEASAPGRIGAESWR